MDAAAALRLSRVLREAAREWAETETGVQAQVTEIRGVNDDPGTECYLFAFRLRLGLFPGPGPDTLTVTIDHVAGKR